MWHTLTKKKQEIRPLTTLKTKRLLATQLIGEGPLLSMGNLANAYGIERKPLPRPAPRSMIRACPHDKWSFMYRTPNPIRWKEHTVLVVEHL